MYDLPVWFYAVSFPIFGVMIGVALIARALRRARAEGVEVGMRKHLAGHPVLMGSHFKPGDRLNVIAGYVIDHPVTGEATYLICGSGSEEIVVVIPKYDSIELIKEGEVDFNRPQIEPGTYRYDVIEHSDLATGKKVRERKLVWTKPVEFELFETNRAPVNSSPERASV